MQEVNTLSNENRYTEIKFANNADVKDKNFVIKGAYTLLMKMKNTLDE
jgi:membrane fusion protein, heavy metal efflux system